MAVIIYCDIIRTIYSTSNFLLLISKTTESYAVLQ